MYNFRDTTETSEVLDGVLPSEALSINGEYIENLIDGYRTLHVSGRESLAAELKTYEVGVRDGSDVSYRRYPARVITVTYQLIAASNEAFRAAYDKLGGILNVDDARLIFNDEQDVFYTGTPTEIGDVEPGRNAVVGEFEIYCADPFKYSIVEYEATQSLDESSILLDYNGTYKAFPILEADFYKESEVGEDGETAGTLTGNGDCGYVAFFTEDEQIIQLGNPDEVDSEKKYEKSQTLVNQPFQSSTAWGTTAKNLWTLNNGHLIPEDVQQMGTVGMNVASYAVPSNPKDTSATVLKSKATTQGAPIFYYSVALKATGRTENSVKVTATITASLKYSSSYFGRPFALQGSIYIGGAWHSVVIKSPSEFWRGKSAHTVNMSFTVSGLAKDTAALTGIKFKVDRTDNTPGYDKVTGALPSVSCSNLAISKYVDDIPETYYLAPTSYGSASSKWHGVSITRTIGADASGQMGAKDFTLTYKQKMCIGQNASGQMGAFQVQLSDASGKNIAGVRIHKNNAGNSASIIFYVNGEKAFETTIDLSYNNENFGAKENAVKTSTIIKSNNTISFYVADIAMSFRNDAIKDMVAAKLTFAFEQYSTVAALSYNGLYWVKFVKNNCDQYRDIPNKFSANDVLEADCKSGEIRLNGVLSPSLGALGNDWETFVLTPGLNQIGTAYSEWVQKEYKPTFKVR